MEKEIKMNTPQIFNMETVSMVVSEIEAGIKAGYVSAKFSTLGGNENVSILILVSLQEKKDWRNGYVENSNYSRFHFYNNGTVEEFSGYGMKKFRKCRVKSVAQLIEKLNALVALGIDKS